MTDLRELLLEALCCRKYTRGPVSKASLVCSETPEEAEPTFITVPLSKVLYVYLILVSSSTAVVNSLIKQCQTAREKEEEQHP